MRHRNLQLFEVCTSALDALSHAHKPVAEASAVLCRRDRLDRFRHRRSELLFRSKANSSQFPFYTLIIKKVERGEIWRIGWVPGQSDFPLSQKSNRSASRVRWCVIVMQTHPVQATIRSNFLHFSKQPGQAAANIYHCAVTVVRCLTLLSQQTLSCERTTQTFACLRSSEHELSAGSTAFHRYILHYRACTSDRSSTATSRHLSRCYPQGGFAHLCRFAAFSCTIPLCRFSAFQ